MTTLLQVPVKKKLTELDAFLIHHLRDYGIIAGGYAAWLWNEEKPASDLDLFVPKGSNLYDVIYQRLSHNLPIGWRLDSSGPKFSSYDSNILLQAITVTNWYEKSKHIKSDAAPDKKGVYQRHIQLVKRVKDDTDVYSNVEGVLASFDWNVCRASVLNDQSLLVDSHFITDMEKNICTFRPYKPRVTTNNDYGWRVYKYVEEKKYDMTFSDMLVMFGISPDKKRFFDQVTSGHAAHDKCSNETLSKFINFVTLMKSTDPAWHVGEF